MALDESDIQAIYSTFSAPVVTFDCGKKCGEINGGLPICCDDRTTVPVLYKSELTLLRKRSSMWAGFRPRDKAEQEMAAELPKEQRFARCKTPRACERDNRSFVCRTFPFFPYFTKDSVFFGLAYYWDYKGRCWILDRYDLVLPDFIDGFVRGWEIVFAKIPADRAFFAEFSARARGVHTRYRRDLVVIGRDHKAYLKRPGEEALVPAPPGPTGPAP